MSRINLATFIFGLTVGSAATWFCLRKRYDQIAQEEIDSVKAAFSERKSEIDAYNAIIERYSKPTNIAHLKQLAERTKAEINKAITEIKVEFEETPNRQEIQSGDEIKTLFGKLKKWLKDLKAVAFSGSYKDLSNKPEIPTVNNAKLTIQKNGTAVKTFTANASTDVTANITVPTKTSELENDSGYKTTDTTYSNFVKSGSGAKSGLVPAPSTTAGTTKYLREDGTWQVPPDNNTVYTHPTTSGNKHIPSGGSSGQILRWSANGTAAWGADNNTTYSNFVKSGTGAKSGLVPAPSTTAGTTKYLREDGTWQVPPNNVKSSETISAAQTSLYTGSSLNTTPVTVEITGLFTKYKAVICNIKGDSNSSTVLPLSYVKTRTSLPYYANNCGHYFRYIDDNTMMIYTGFAQSNPKINSVEIISLY